MLHEHEGDPRPSGRGRKREGGSISIPGSPVSSLSLDLAVCIRRVEEGLCLKQLGRGIHNRLE